MGNLLALEIEFSNGYKVISYFGQKSVSLQHLLIGPLREQLRRQLIHLPLESFLVI